MYNGFSGLEPWTLYSVRVALYTSLAVNGTGPWSDWQLVQTLQAGEELFKNTQLVSVAFIIHALFSSIHALL